MGQRALHQGVVQPVGVVEAHQHAGVLLLNPGQGTLRHAPEGGVNQVVAGGEGDVLPVEHNVLHDPLDVVPVDPVVAVHGHVGDGGGAVAHLQVADVHALVLQAADHPLPGLVAAGGADDGRGDAQLLEVHPGVHAVSCGIAPVDLLPVDGDVEVDAVVADHCRSLHRFSLPPSVVDEW